MTRAGTAKTRWRRADLAGHHASRGLAAAICAVLALSAAPASAQPRAVRRAPGAGLAQDGSARAALPRGAVPAVPGQARFFSVVGGRQLAARGVVVNYPSPRAPRVPDVPASAWVVADAGTGQVLAAKDPHGWFPPASTLKVLTAVTLMPVLNPGQTVIASRWAAGTEPSKVGLIAGQAYRVGDLFKALLLISANDAAVALAQATGSYSRAITMMNAEARHLQADDTVARTPNGLDARGQRVSAYDEALIARQALNLPQFMRDEALTRTLFPLRPHHLIPLFNQNMMLETYRGDLGGKIGWTTPAEATFIGWARRGGRTLIVTILHCTPLTEMPSAAKLLNWGFAMDGKVAPVGALVSPLPAPSAPASAHAPARLAAAKTPGPPALPIAAGAAAFALVVLAGAGVVLASRRSRRRTRSAS